MFRFDVNWLAFLRLPAPRTATTAKELEMKPVQSGYAEVNGLKMYYEIYGSGDPVVLLHGPFMTTHNAQSEVDRSVASIRPFRIDRRVYDKNDH